jgi:hypothetical protein
METILIYIKPFVSISQCSIAIEIIQKYESICISVDIINKYFKTTYTVDDIDKFYKRSLAFPNMFPNEYIENIEKIKIKINKISIESDARQIIRNIDIKKCFICKELLILNTNSYIEAHLYLYNEKSKPCLVEKKECRKCKKSYYLSFYTNNKGEKYFYGDSCSSKFFSISNETVIETILLLSLNADIMYKHASFKNFCSSFNSLFQHSNSYKRGLKNDY